MASAELAEFQKAPLSMPSPREFLRIPGKYLLTDLGVSYCSQKRIPMKELRLHRGTTALGFDWTSINTELLGQFVTHGMMSGLELERIEFLDKRQEIVRLSEVIFRGIARKRFLPLLRKRLREDPVYKKVVDLAIPSQSIRTILEKHKRAVSSLRESLRSRLKDNVSNLGATESLLNLVDPTVWFLLLHDPGVFEGGTLKGKVHEFLRSYLGRLELSEAVSLVLMEFLQQAEKAHFINLAERDRTNAGMKRLPP